MDHDELIQRRRRFLFAACGVILTTPGLVHSQNAPLVPSASGRTLTQEVVVPYAPGGGSDLLGRWVVEAFVAAGATKVVVVNQPGVAGTLGSRQVALAAPDGGSWLISGLGSHVIAPQWQPVSYDPFKDFEHLAILGGYPSVLVTHASRGYEQLEDLRAGLSWASPGTGSHGHLLGTAVMQRLGLNDAVHVPYKGGASALNDLMGGHVDVGVMTLPSFLPQAQNPQLRVLAISSGRRIDLIKSVPTFAELGMKDLTAFTWFSLSAPKGLRPDRVNWAVSALKTLYATDSLQERMRQHGVGAVELRPGHALRFMQDEWVRWGKVMSALGPKGRENK